MPNCSTMDRGSSLKWKPLQALCIKTIVEHFDRFWLAYCLTNGTASNRRFEFLNSAYKSIPSRLARYMHINREKATPDPNLKILSEQLEFLQRNYSTVLLTQLRLTWKLKDEHLSYVVNEHCKVLNMWEMNRFGIRAGEKVLKAVGDELVELTISSYCCECNLPKKTRRISFTRLINLKKKISIRNCDFVMYHPPDCCDIDALVNVKGKRCHNAEKLPPQVLNSALYRLRNLVTLYMAGTMCTDDTLKIVGLSCPSLKSLDISYCKWVTNDGLRNLFCVRDDSALCQLSYLNFYKSGANYDLLTFIMRNMPNLEVIPKANASDVLLEMHRREFLDDRLSQVQPYNLTILSFDLSEKAIKECLIVCTSLCPNVRRLDLTKTNAATLRLCCRFRKLNNVRISFNEDNSLGEFLRDKGAQLIVLNLRFLTVAANDIAQYCPNLKRLLMFMVRFKLYGMWSMASMVNLQSMLLCQIDFRKEEATQSAIALLGATPNMESLGLVSCLAVGADLCNAVLGRLMRLKELDLRYSQVEKPYLEIIRYRSERSVKLKVACGRNMPRFDSASYLRLAERWSSSAND